MQVSVEELPGRLVSLFRVDGAVDDTTADQLRRALAETIADGCRTLYVDLSATPAMSESGLRELLRAARKMRENHGAFHLVGPQPAIRGALRTSTLDRVIVVHSSLDDVPGHEPAKVPTATVPAPSVIPAPAAPPAAVPAPATETRPARRRSTTPRSRRKPS